MQFRNPNQPVYSTAQQPVAPYKPQAAEGSYRQSYQNAMQKNPYGPQNAGNSMWDTYGSGSSVYHQLRDPGWSTGQTFQANSKIEAIDALKKAQTVANPEDYAAMDAMRKYYSGALSQLPSNSANNVSVLDTQMQRGLNNLLGQHATASAGTGRLGSRQYAGEAGDISSRMASEYMNGLIAAKNNELSQANMIGAGLQGVQLQDLKERDFQGQQAGRYAGLISDFMNQDQGRESGLMQAQATKDAANKQLWGQIIGSAVGAGGMMLAPTPKIINGVVS